MMEYAAYKVRVSPEVMEQWTRCRTEDGRLLTFEWGEPDSDGFYEPWITRHDDDRLVSPDALRRIREGVAGLRELSDAATPGPWRWSDWSVVFGPNGNYEDPESDNVRTLEHFIGPGDPTFHHRDANRTRVLSLEENPENPADAELIVAAVNYIRTLLIDTEITPDRTPTEEER